jgi:hypothetical protein
MSTADRQQAHYFGELLGEIRAELIERIAGLNGEMSMLEQLGDVEGFTRLRRNVRALEKELRGMDQMLEALRLRLKVLLAFGA